MNNKKFIIFIIAAVLIIGAVVLTLTLKDRAELISAEEAEAILTELLPKAEEINDIIWGEGLPVEPGQDEALKTVTAAQYRTVAKDAPYQSIDELKTAIASVYSDAFIENTINYAAFEGAEDALEDTAAQMYPRYSENDTGVLLVDITNPGFELTTEIDASTVKVVDAEKNKQHLEVESNAGTLKIVIVLQENGWRLDTPTY